MTPAKGFLSAIDFLNIYTGKTVSWLNLVVMIIIAIEVIARYGFSRPTIWAWDINVLLIASVALLGAGYALLQGAHVKVDVLSARLSPRGRAVLDMVSSSLFFLAIGMLVWKSWEQGMLSVRLDEHVSSLFNPPLYPLKIALAVAVSLLFLQGVAKFMRDLAIVRSKGDRS